MKKLIALFVLLIPVLLYAAKTGTITVDGNTDLHFSEGTRGVISFSGDFGSGTITVLYLVGDTYVNFKDSAGANISYTDDNGFEFVIPEGTKTGDANEAIRVTLTGATAPDIDYALSVVRF